MTHVMAVLIGLAIIAIIFCVDYYLRKHDTALFIVVAAVIVGITLFVGWMLGVIVLSLFGAI